MWCPTARLRIAFCGSCLKHWTSQLVLPLLAPLESWSLFSWASRCLFDILLTCAFAKQVIVPLLIGQDPVSRGRVCAHQVITDISPQKSSICFSFSFIDGVGSALKVAAQPDLLRRAGVSPRSLLCPQRALGNNPVSLPFPVNSAYLLTLREAMKAALTDQQAYDTAFTSDGFLSLSFSHSLFLQSLSILTLSLSFFPATTSQSVVSPFFFFFFPSHGPCWHRNPSLLTRGESGTCWRPLLFMRQCDPLCHPLSARGVCLNCRFLYSLYQPGVANEKHQVNTTTRTAIPLNLLIHLDTANWNPCELHSGHHPFSCQLWKGNLYAIWSNFFETDAKINSPWTH